jgi:hypothetical protein
VGTKKFVGLQRAETPLIVFINAKSGGRVGPRLATVLFHALGQGQVFDLADSKPGPVLKTIWENLLAREKEGDQRASHIRRCTNSLICCISFCVCVRASSAWAAPCFLGQ